MTKSLAEMLHLALLPDSIYEKEIINQSVPHTKRDRPAWMYSLDDAKRAITIEQDRLKCSEIAGMK